MGGKLLNKHTASELVFKMTGKISFYIFNINMGDILQLPKLIYCFSFAIFVNVHLYLTVGDINFEYEFFTDLIHHDYWLVQAVLFIYFQCT